MSKFTDATDPLHSRGRAAERLMPPLSDDHRDTLAEHAATWLTEGWAAWEVVPFVREHARKIGAAVTDIDVEAAIGRAVIDRG